MHTPDLVDRTNDAPATCFDRAREAIVERARIGIAGQDRDRDRNRGRAAGVARALGETLDSCAQHFYSARGVKVQVSNTLTPEDARRPADRRRDVVQLDIGEDVEIECAHVGDRVESGACANTPARVYAFGPRRLTPVAPPGPI